MYGPPFRITGKGFLNALLLAGKQQDPRVLGYLEIGGDGSVLGLQHRTGQGKAEKQEAGLQGWLHVEGWFEGRNYNLGVKKKNQVFTVLIALCIRCVLDRCSSFEKLTLKDNRKNGTIHST